MAGEYSEEQNRLFLHRWNELLRLRAEKNDFDLPSKLSDAEHRRQFEDVEHRLEDAERLLMTTLATEEWMVLRKFEVLEAAVVEHIDAPFADQRIVWMLAAVKANIMATGLAN